MKKSKHSKNKGEKDISYPNISSTVSSGECTGVMPRPPQNEEELESYQDLSDMQFPSQDED